MTFEIHPFVKDADDLDRSVFALSVEQKVSWPTHSFPFSHHTIAAVPEMVRQQPRGDFRTCGLPARRRSWATSVIACSKSAS